MAYAAVITLKLTLQNIFLHPDRYSIPCEKKHIETFHEKLEFLQRFLEEYPSHKSNEKVSSLETRIRDAAYEAEDFMDLHLKNLPVSEKMMRQIINIELMMKKVDSIIEEVAKIEEEMGLEIEQGRDSSMEEDIKTLEEPPDALREDSSSSTKNLMVGFDEYLMQIKDQLTGQSPTLEVISIVGMGGIGKTTLATYAYDDPCVVYNFDVRAWATISQSYSVRDVLLSMLDSMKTLTHEMYRESDDKLGLHVYQNLKGRRYLITIDDIWDTNAWDDLKMMFPDDKTGSRIMLTTRTADVAAYASRSGTLHQISLLSDDQSWKLLCAKVFGDEPCPFNLQEIGKRVAKKCQGLPISIVVIGGLLSNVEKTQMAWQSIAKNVSSFVFSNDDQCSDLLRLSYNYLPQYLKACFLYMGLFPKSQEIRVSKLIKMWVAEGFLRQAHAQSSEEVAERCVKDLVDRSLILISKKNSVGKIKACRIHDLLHDVCSKESKKENFLQIIKSNGNLLPHDLASERRISIHPLNAFIHPMKAFKNFMFGNFYLSYSYVRSLVCVGPCQFSSWMFLRLKLLRVLDAIQVWFPSFPSQALKLLNLRYIALSIDGEVPASITKLWNLQTLIISGAISGCLIKPRLPVGIWTMLHLRHVSCDGALLHGPVATMFDFDRKHLVLDNLQTLSGLCNLKFTKEMLQSIPNIKKINVSYDSRFLRRKKWSEFQLENLGSLNQLEALQIRVISIKGRYKLFNSSPRFEFNFPPSIKRLTLGGVGIPWHDLTIIGSLPNLEVLKLIDRACLGTEWEPNEEEFSKLKVLVLERLDLEHWSADSYHFPCLQHLVIRLCFKLVEIPSGMGEMPTLTMIELEGCQDSALASANEILEKQQSYGNDGFQVIYKKRSEFWEDMADEVDGVRSLTAEIKKPLDFLQSRVRSVFQI